jgi:tRNA(Ile)-lysidine synthase
MPRRELSIRLEPPVGGGVLVAASAGADSTALAILLADALGAAGATWGPLHLGHVQHGFRPAVAAQEVAALRSLSRSLGVPLHVVTAAPPAGWSAGDKIPEAAARETRRRLLVELAVRLGVRVVALAHHARDQLETQLLQLARGGGLRALRGMAPVRSRDGLLWWRPLLERDPEELRALLLRRGVAWCEDASNQDLRLRRNAVRHRWLPALVRSGDPLLARAAVLSRLASAALARIERFATSGDFVARPSVRAGALRRRAAPIARASPALLHELVRAWAGELLGERADAVLARGRESRELTAWLRSDVSGARRSGDLVAERSRDWILLRDAARAPAPDRSLHVVGADAAAQLTGSAASVRFGKTGDPGAAAGADVVFVPPAVRVTLRARRPGDRVALAEGHDVALSRLLVDAGSLLGERDFWPIVCIDDLPAWVPGARRVGAALSRVPRAGWRALIASGIPHDEARAVVAAGAAGSVGPRPALS